MSNRTKIKKKESRREESAVNPVSVPGRQYWQPPQTLLATVIFLTLGIAILAKSLYQFVPAGIILIGVLLYSGFTASRSGRGMRFVLTPVILIAILILVKVYISLNR